MILTSLTGSAPAAPTQLDNILTLSLVGLLALVVIIAVIRKAVSNKTVQHKRDAHDFDHVCPVFLIAGFGGSTLQRDTVSAKLAKAKFGPMVESCFRHFECFSFIISVSQKVLTKDRSTNNQDCTNDLHRQQLFTKKNHGEQHS